MNRKRTAKDFYPLTGFTLTAVTDIPDDGTYFTFRNNRGVEIEVLYDGRAVFATEPYGVDQNGNRTQKRSRVIPAPVFLFSSFPDKLFAAPISSLCSSRNIL